MKLFQSLRLSLAELFMKLGKYDSALDVCAKAKKFLQAADNVEAMISSTKIYLLEAKVKSQVWLQVL